MDGLYYNNEAAKLAFAARTRIPGKAVGDDYIAYRKGVKAVARKPHIGRPAVHHRARTATSTTVMDTCWARLAEQTPARSPEHQEHGRFLSTPCSRTSFSKKYFELFCEPIQGASQQSGIPLCQGVG
jgi:hypothetical protein